MLLRPLPVQDPERLVNLTAPGPKPGSQSCNQAGDCDEVFSYPMFRDLERGQTVLHRPRGAPHLRRQPGPARRALERRGHAGLGLVLPHPRPHPGARPPARAEDDATIGAGVVAVLSYGFWQSRARGGPGGPRPDASSSTGSSLTIVGVAPRGFDGTTLGTQPMVFVPITMRGDELRASTERSRTAAATGSTCSGGSSPASRSSRRRRALNGIYQPIINDVEAPLQKGMSDADDGALQGQELIGVDAGPPGQSSMHREAQDAAPDALRRHRPGAAHRLRQHRQPAAGARRRRGAEEMGVRLALGASRAAAADPAADRVGAARPAGRRGEPRWLRGGRCCHRGAAAAGRHRRSCSFELQPPVVLFTAALALGDRPALRDVPRPAQHPPRPDHCDPRQRRARSPGARGAARFRTALVTAQIALAMALLDLRGAVPQEPDQREPGGPRASVDNVVTFGLSPRAQRLRHHALRRCCSSGWRRSWPRCPGSPA